MAKTIINMLRVNFFLGLGYFLGGYLGSLIAILASHASPIWPAAGIALAGLLTFGRGVLPGIWLGACITQAYSFSDTANLEITFNTLILGTVIGTASTAQSALGAWLIKRYVGINDPLIDDRSIFRFMTLGGPLSCMVCATVGIVTLYLNGYMSINDLPAGWGTWWIGDTVGVFIFTPFMLCLIGANRDKWRARINSVALPSALLLVLVIALFQLAKHQEQARITTLFKERVSLLHNALQNEFNNHIETNQILKAFFDSSVQVTPNDFKTFTRTVFNNHGSIQALEWIPRITADNQDFYQELLGSEFKIRIPDGKQGMMPAPLQADYFAIAYLEPYEGNEPAFGFDISSNPTAYKALQRAQNNAQTAVTEKLRLVQDAENRPGIVIYSPVYQAGQPLHTQEQRRQHLRGVVASALLVSNEVNEVAGQFNHLQLLLKITDGNTELYNEKAVFPNQQQAFQKLEKIMTLSVADRTWQVIYHAKPQFIAGQLSWYMWWLTLSGFLFTSLTGIGLLMLTGRTMQTEDLVKIRTRELETEIVERKKIIQQRNDHNQVLQAIVSSAPLIDILKLIVIITEQNHPDALCSILLLDEQGKHLHLGVAPSLPAFFNQAIDGFPVGEGMGVCGTAAYTGKRVIVEDIYHHPYCRDFLSLANQAGLAACWSEPILSPIGQVLGTFAVYHRTPHRPSPALVTEFNNFAQLASIAIERKRSEEQIYHLAFFDVLTSLPNRRLFYDRLENSLAKNLRHHTNTALLYLDLDHFKTLNDSLGHQVGDELLIEVAMRLKQSVRDEDTVARLGGDEFVILLDYSEITQETMQEHALTMAERVQLALQAPFQLKNHIHHITSSIGITLIPQPGTSTDQLLKQADTAMYYAKNRGRNTVSFYNEDMQHRADHRLMLEKDLRDALVNQQFSLHYQPQFDADQKLIGAEALLRWQHPEKGMISPTDFIPVAEETGLILIIGEWVLQEACSQLQCWPDVPHIAVNISPKQFHQPKFEAQIIRLLADYPMAIPRLTLEITEGIVIEDIKDSIRKLHAMQNLGLDISIDDFGTGYSSLAYLKNLPLNQLKIDQSFVRDISIDSNNAVIVKTIIAMAKHLGLSLIAEGVETTEQMQFLRDNGCKGYQGHFFSKALTTDEFTGRFIKT